MKELPSRVKCTVAHCHKCTANGDACLKCRKGYFIGTKAKKCVPREYSAKVVAITNLPAEGKPYKTDYPHTIHFYSEDATVPGVVLEV